MKDYRGHKPAIAAAGAWLLSNLTVGSRALHYVYAAQHDERTGFPYTAATEMAQCRRTPQLAKVSRVLLAPVGAHHALAETAGWTHQHCSTELFITGARFSRAPHNDT